MLSSARLPTFTFIDEKGSATVLRCSEATARIRAVAARLAAKIEPGSAIGLLHVSGPDLVINWLACLLAKLRPLVMQYPTRKQSRQYWSDSVRNTIDIAGLAAIVADDHCAGLGLGKLLPVIAQSGLEELPQADASPFTLADFAIIQLSSGTTGHRKAIEFPSAFLERHVADYNATLQLTPDDRIVSWLPLYHDMGYIACFVMPLALGIDVVMLDPMVWVRKPELLFDAIERHQGSICYMPNFGFEVMARCPPRPLPSMRWWISCSEPVSTATATRFLAGIGAPLESFSACYAMAENVFAVSFSRGLKSLELDGATVVSCGPPIRGVRVKIVDGEVWVRSPASLKAYLGGTDIRDAQGFYATGDLGAVIDGELYITGRKGDLLIQAGRKYMLSDIDLVLNQLYPDIKGRAAAVQVYDERLGTQKPLVLIESMDFYLREDQSEIGNRLKSAIGLDQIEVQFVPPRFLTKTSSGKFNRRKSAEHWQLVCAARAGQGHSGTDPVAELESSFGKVDWTKPVEAVLDSLSLTVLRIILSDTPVAYDGQATLEKIRAQVQESASPAGPLQAEKEIRIVVLADTRSLETLEEKHLKRLGKRLGARVVMEHICLPPSPIVLSDLIFHDYFQPRLEQAPFAAVDRAFAKLRSASLILVDDIAEMFFPPHQVYGVLSHNLERDPRTDLIVFRWQRYAQFHDRLPLTLVTGADLPLDESTRGLERLGRYVGKPIFRMSQVAAFSELTADWELRMAPNREPGSSFLRAANPNRFIKALVDWIESEKIDLERYPRSSASALEMSDLRHYCSHLLEQGLVDRFLEKFDSFCIVGQPSSLPYVRKRLQETGKRFTQVPSYAPEILENLDGEYECVAICGSMGAYPVRLPAAALMKGTAQWAVQHIDDAELGRRPFKLHPRDCPPSGEDWYCPIELERQRTWNYVEEAREMAHAVLKQRAAALAERRQQRQEQRASQPRRASRVE